MQKPMACRWHCLLAGIALLAGSALDAEEPRALFFGVWRKVKGLPVLMDAFDLLVAKQPELSGEPLYEYDKFPEDKTEEGLENEGLQLFSVQYHPEASPGPHESGYLFSRFAELMDARRNRAQKN